MYRDFHHILLNSGKTPQLFCRRGTILYLFLTIIPGHPLIPGGNSTKPCSESSFVTDSGGLISCKGWINGMDLMGETMKRSIVHMTAGETPIIAAHAHSYQADVCMYACMHTSWLVCIVYLIHAHLRSCLIFWAPSNRLSDMYHNAIMCY